MKNLFLSLLLLGMSVSPALAQETMPVDILTDIPQIPESHSYTYVVKEDGSAQVWLRVDGLSSQTTESVYELTLPDGFKGTAMVWSRENGCLQYRNDVCSYYGSTSWKEIPYALNGQNLSITIPKATVIPRNPNENDINLGISFEIDQVTDQKWWGRLVNITSAKSKQFVSYLNIGVYVPEGVFTRDRSQGPSGWAASITNTIAANQSKPEGMGGADSLVYSSMLDMTGSGQIYRNRNGLMPNQNYQFSFMSSTAMWKLFYTEIGFAIGWLFAIGVVIALLLRLIIGKKPLSWYFSVVGLLVLLGMLFGGLWFTFQTSQTRDYGYPIPLFKGAEMRGSGGAAEPAVDIMPAPADAEMTLESTPEFAPELPTAE